MAKVAVPGSLSSNSLPFERGVSKVQAGATMKRKTPSELRDEQLKRRSCTGSVNEFSSSLGSEKTTEGTTSVAKVKDAAKTPKYIDTRVNEVYPVRKSSNRLMTMQYLKEKAKNKVASEQNIGLKHSSATSYLDPESHSQQARLETSEVLNTSSKDGSTRACSVLGKCSQNTFNKVSDISLGIEKPSTITKTLTNMEALKTLGARDPPAASNLPNGVSEKIGDSSFISLGNFSTEFHIPGHKIPLDFTLKTTMKLVSSSSVKWCHRLINSSDFNGMSHFTSQHGSFGNQNTLRLPGHNSTSVALFSKSLHSWIYPQSSLPPSVISALTACGAQGDMDFLLKRQLAWEDSFRNLYYMLRKNRCNIFYVRTPHFVVMFTGGDSTGKKKRICNAYVSQSTRGLRCLLREHEVSFSMPLCHSEVENASAEDLVELSEIKKGSLGQTRRSSSASDVKDNSPQSLLAFTGNCNVHALYDFLLNYRSFLSSLIGGDVPVLYAPVLFRNASISVPEVKCKEMKRAHSISVLPKGMLSEDDESPKDSPNGLCYSIEIKDTILPPWIVSGLCAAMGSENRSFEASFITESTSTGLNVALDAVLPESDAEIDSCKDLQHNSQCFGIPEVVLSPSLRSGSLTGLKYKNDSYTASLLPL